MCYKIFDLQSSVWKINYFVCFKQNFLRIKELTYKIKVEIWKEKKIKLILKKNWEGADAHEIEVGTKVNIIDRKK